MRFPAGRVPRKNRARPVRHLAEYHPHGTQEQSPLDGRFQIKPQHLVLFFLLFPGIHRGTVDDEPIDAVFGDQVDDHRPSQYKVVGDSQLDQGVSPPSGERGENSIIDAQLQHGFRNVVCTLEGESSIHCEVVDDAGDQGCQVTGPVGKMEKLLKECKTQYLDGSGTDGEK